MDRERSEQSSPPQSGKACFHVGGHHKKQVPLWRTVFWILVKPTPRDRGLYARNSPPQSALASMLAKGRATQKTRPAYSGLPI